MNKRAEEGFKYSLPKFGNNIDNYWSYIVFEIEYNLQQYTEDSIRNEWDVEEVIKKYVMLQNKLHVERQYDIEMKVKLNPFGNGKQNFKPNDVPYKLAPKRKKRTLDEARNEIWEKAPVVNDSEFDRFRTRFMRK